MILSLLLSTSFAATYTAGSSDCPSWALCTAVPAAGSVAQFETWASNQLSITSGATIDMDGDGIPDDPGSLSSEDWAIGGSSIADSLILNPFPKFPFIVQAPGGEIHIYPGGPVIFVPDPLPDTGIAPGEEEDTAAPVDTGDGGDTSAGGSTGVISGYSVDENPSSAEVLSFMGGFQVGNTMGVVNPTSQTAYTATVGALATVDHGYGYSTTQVRVDAPNGDSYLVLAAGTAIYATKI